MGLPLPSPGTQSYAIASSFLIHKSSLQRHGYISVLRASKPHLGYQSVVNAVLEIPGILATPHKPILNTFANAVAIAVTNGTSIKQA